MSQTGIVISDKTAIIEATTESNQRLVAVRPRGGAFNGNAVRIRSSPLYCKDDERSQGHCPADGWEDGRKVESKPGDQPAAKVTRVFGGERARHDSPGTVRM